MDQQVPTGSRTEEFLRLRFAVLPLFAVAVLCGIVPYSDPTQAIAVLVAPGDTVPLGGTTVAADPDLAGTVISDVLRPFEIRDNLNNVILTGRVQDRVVRSSNTGTLIFMPRVRDLDDLGSDAWVVGLEVTGYAGRSTDVDYRTDVLGEVGPNDVQRDPLPGDGLFFRYDPNIIFAPNSALFPVIFTAAPLLQQRGTITVYAQNDFGASVFSTSLLDTNAPGSRGDVNIDGLVNGLDVKPFVDRVVSGLYLAEADMNDDGAVNGLDVKQFIAAVVGNGTVETVPEPSALILAAVALLGLLCWRRAER